MLDHTALLPAFRVRIVHDRASATFLANMASIYRQAGQAHAADRLEQHAGHKARAAEQLAQWCAPIGIPAMPAVSA